MKRTTILCGLLLLATVALSPSARATSNFSYDQGATFGTGAPQSTYTVGGGGTAHVTVTVNSTCTVRNTDMSNSHAGTWHTGAEASFYDISTNPWTVIIDVIHTETDETWTLLGGGQHALKNSSASGSADVGPSMYYNARAWSIVKNVSPDDIAFYTDKADKMVGVH